MKTLVVDEGGMEYNSSGMRWEILEKVTTKSSQKTYASRSV